MRKARPRKAEGVRHLFGKLGKGDVLGKLKQATDARFQEDALGWFVSGGFSKRGDEEDGLVWQSTSDAKPTSQAS